MTHTRKVTLKEILEEAAYEKHYGSVSEKISTATNPATTTPRTSNVPNAIPTSVSTSQHVQGTPTDETNFDTAPLTTSEKKYLVKTIADYNSYRPTLKATDIQDVVKKISNAVKLADRYVAEQCDEWMQADVAKRDMKELSRLCDKMNGELTKLQGVANSLEMIYEDIGIKLDRYFEIK